MITKTVPELYIVPGSLQTIVAKTASTHLEEEEGREWEKKPGDYLYLHPYWYTFDAESKLELVMRIAGKIDLEAPSSLEVLRLELETSIDLPMSSTCEVIRVELNSMVIISDSPDEPEHMFHTFDYAIFGGWLYQANERGILFSVGRVPSQYRNKSVEQALDLVKRHNPKFLRAMVNWPPERAWKFGDDKDAKETSEELTQSLISAFYRRLNSEGKRPKIGDHIVMKTSDGYKLEVYCVPPPSDMPARSGCISFCFAMKIYDPEGNVLSDTNQPFKTHD